MFNWLQSAAAAARDNVVKLLDCWIVKIGKKIIFNWLGGARGNVVKLVDWWSVKIA